MAEATVTDSGLDRRRWVLLWVIGLAQLMVVLDLTVVYGFSNAASHSWARPITHSSTQRRRSWPPPATVASAMTITLRSLANTPYVGSVSAFDAEIAFAVC